MGTVSVAAWGRFAERPRLPLADEGGVAEAEALRADPRTNAIPAIDDDDDDRKGEDIPRVRDDDVVAVATALTALALINMAVRYVSLLSVHIYYMRFR